jgi:predicted component of type VI protein secretion system
MKTLNSNQVFVLVALAVCLSGCCKPQPVQTPPTVVRQTNEDTTKTVSSEPVIGQPAK